MQKHELTRLVENEYNQFVRALLQLSETQLHTSVSGKWTPAQVAEHLHLSIRPVTLAFGLPGFVLKFFFGVANRPSRTYEELVGRYQQKLAAGGRATRAFIPALQGDVSVALSRLNQSSQKLRTRVGRFSEAQLDQLLLPHPLLGKLTLREMLYFTAYHAQHHRRQLQ